MALEMSGIMVDLSSGKVRQTADIIRFDFRDETDEFFTNLGITKNDYIEGGLFEYLIKLNDGYYYTKAISEFHLCNEIIGRLLCNRLSLVTTTLDLLNENGILRMISPNFRKKEFEYRILEESFFPSIDLFSIDKLITIPKDYQIEQLKLITIDLAMQQWDRHPLNMEEVIINGNIHLAPVIDFSFSFLDFPGYSYNNPYVALPKKIKDIDKFLNAFPDAYKFFEDIFSLDASDLIFYIEEDYPIIVEDDVVSEYIEVTAKNQKILDKIR